MRITAHRKLSLSTWSHVSPNSQISNLKGWLSLGGGLLVLARILSERTHSSGDHVLHGRHRAHARVAAREHLDHGRNHFDAALTQRGQVLGRHALVPHEGVHGGSDDQRAPHCVQAESLGQGGLESRLRQGARRATETQQDSTVGAAGSAHLEVIVPRTHDRAEQVAAKAHRCLRQ